MTAQEEPEPHEKCELNGQIAVEDIGRVLGRETQDRRRPGAHRVKERDVFFIDFFHFKPLLFFLSFKNSSPFFHCGGFPGREDFQRREEGKNNIFGMLMSKRKGTKEECIDFPGQAALLLWERFKGGL